MASLFACRPEDVTLERVRELVAIAAGGAVEAQLRALHGLNSRMHGITVMTYDQLVSQCHALLSHVTAADEATESEPSELTA
ncbi:hypothetical protein [Streptomyces sp. NPDC059010]|uniref:hypothetical protein n=1 Tax=Streptomyces sp. NPDC059010 TaxID=3346695 RepID=UPI0036CD3329